MKKTGETVTCAQCGKAFYLRGAYLGTRRYCSRPCYDRSRAPQPRECPGCGKVFQPIKGRQKFCSYACPKRGERNPNWLGGVSADRPGREEFRRQVLKRDGRKCMLCGSRKELHAHH